MFGINSKKASTQDAYEKFKTEGTEGSKQENSKSHLKSNFNITTDEADRAREYYNDDTIKKESVANGRSHDPDRIKRERFIESVSKDIQEIDDSFTQNLLFVKQSREQLKRFRVLLQNSQINIDVMYRLRDDNAVITESLTKSNKRNDSLNSELTSEIAKSQSATNRYSEMRTGLEKAREEIIGLIERDSEYRVELERFTSEANQRESELLRTKRFAEKFEIENITLADQNNRLSHEVDEMASRHLRLELGSEETIAKLRNEKELNESLVSKNTSLAQELEIHQTENVELTSQLHSSEHDAEELEKQNRDKDRITDEELYSLRARAEGFQSQLRVKSQINRDLQEQSRVSLAEAKVSKEESRSLHDRLVETMRQREGDQEDISGLNTEIGELNERFKQLLSELEQSRSENVKLRRSLKLHKESWGSSLTSIKNAPTETEQRTDLEGAKEQVGRKPH